MSTQRIEFVNCPRVNVGELQDFLSDAASQLRNSLLDQLANMLDGMDRDKDVVLASGKGISYLVEVEAA